MAAFTVIVMDNATDAGTRGRGDARRGEPDVLAHHRIDARFMTPFRCWEKGAVENAGFLRRKSWSAGVRDHAQLDAGSCSTDAMRWLPARHYRGGTAIGTFGEYRVAPMLAFHHTRPGIRVEEPCAGRQVRQIDTTELVPRRRCANGASPHAALSAGTACGSSIPVPGDVVARCPRVYGSSQSTLRD